MIVNSYFQRALKGSKVFQDENERVFIVENLRIVDKCFLSIDKDRTGLHANGGDQNNDTIPEGPICVELGIDLIDGLGGKIQSSSLLLKN